MDGWNTTFLLGRPIFRGCVSFREGNSCESVKTNDSFITNSQVCFGVHGAPAKACGVDAKGAGGATLKAVDC